MEEKKEVAWFVTILEFNANDENLHVMSTINVNNHKEGIIWSWWLDCYETKEKNKAFIAKDQQK